MFLFHVRRTLFFIKFDREAVGVAKEDETFRGVFVGADFFVGNVHAVELGEGFVDVVDFKCDVAEPCGFGSCGPCGRMGEGEEFDEVLAVEGEVGFVGLSLGAIMFGEDGESEHPGVEVEAATVVGADDGYVV